MFSNMSKREKMLGMAFLAIVPLVLLVVVVMWVNGSLNDKRLRLRALENQINQEELLKEQRMRASERRFEYTEASLSSNPDNAEKYRQWLNGLMEKHNLKNGLLLNKGYQKLRYAGVSDVAYVHDYQITGIGTLPQLVGFLDDFYRMNILHQIKSLSVIPKASGEAGNQERSGELGLTITVEALGLVDAEASKPVPTEPGIKLDKTLEDYEYSIVRRNIFGPPNNAPTLSVRDQSEDEGEEISFNIRGRDEDDHELTFELIESSVPGAKLGEKSSPDSTAVEFTAPALAEGEYKFKVRVTDNGVPAKFSEEEFYVNVEKKAPPRVDTGPKITKRKPFIHATQSKITALVQGSDSKPQVWINVRTKGDFYQLAVGESFELDEYEWIVQDISVADNHVVMQCDGKEMTFARGDFLSDPRNVVEVTATDKGSTSNGHSEDEETAEKDRDEDSPVIR